MRSSLRYIFLFIVVFFTEGTAGPDPRRVADSLKRAGDLNAAALYFEKAAFLAPENDVAAFYLLESAACLRESDRYRDAYSLLSKIPTISLSDSLISEIKTHCALLAYLERNFNTAESEIKQVRYLTGDSVLSKKADMFLVLILHEQYRWQEAKLILKRHVAERFAFSPLLASRELARIDSLYNERLVPKIKKEKTAIALATWLPGMGQAYAGRPLEGMVSMAVIVASAGGMVLGVISQYYFTSIMIGNLLIGKFYQGSVRRTELILRQTNYSRTQAFNLRLKQSLAASLKD